MGEDYITVGDVEWVLSICYDPTTMPSNFNNVADYFDAIQNWSVSNPFGLLTPTFLPSSTNFITIADNFFGGGADDAWLAAASTNGDFEADFTISMFSSDNPLTGIALVPPWSLADFTTSAGANGTWTGEIEGVLHDATWGGVITDIQVTNKVPEPATLTLLAAGLLAGAAFRKRYLQ